MSDVISAIDAIAHEATLFAAIGLIIGGVDDLLVDLLFLAVGRREACRPTVATLALATGPGRLAVFVPAWDEASVIATMVSTALARLDHADYRIYVGTYPNDAATFDAVAPIATSDARVRLVVGTTDGPTTKADCLNTLWRALLADEARDDRPTKAVILHDAEDLVHPAELRVFDSLIEGHAVVQLPVLPLIKRDARLVSGHYADEFAEAHGKAMIVRAALHAAMPLAGTGCAIARAMLGRIADARDGTPFDATSVTEDYELGLRIASLGGRGLFARIRDDDGPVAVRAYFPTTIRAAARQKARWMTGIALAGWDRTGWARAWAIGDHWMRMRDRRAPIAVVVLAVAYLAIVAWLVRLVVGAVAAVPFAAAPSIDPRLLAATGALLGWRATLRMVFTARCYGWREALWSLPRMIVGNLIALLAAPRAFARYLAMLRGEPPVWDKTKHEFPVLRGTDIR